MEILSVTAVRASRFSRAPLECSRHRSPVAAGWLHAEITAGPKRDFSYERIRLRAFALRSQLAERIPKMSSASMKCTVKVTWHTPPRRSAPLSAGRARWDFSPFLLSFSSTSPAPYTKMAMFLSGVPQLGFAPTLPVISPMTTRPAAVMSAADKLCAAHTQEHKHSAPLSGGASAVSPQPFAPLAGRALRTRPASLCGTRLASLTWARRLRSPGSGMRS